MANQPKKYTKFVAAAATATLVASAIVPVASAAGFSDVADTNSHAVNINALAEAGIIGGYPDGTFKPNQELTRGQVVKMLGKWVEKQGFEIPADYATKARFTDLAADAKDQELVKYAALVFDTGVFAGSNGALNAGGKITRENMALVLDRAFKAINDTTLVEVAAEIEDIKIADLNTAKAEAREAIQALRNLGISGVENFMPKDSVTRAQFATFLNKTIQTESAVELTVKEAVAVDANTVEVTLSDDTKHTVKLETALEANKATEIKFTINEKEFTAEVTYVVEKLLVEEVKAVNAKTLEVTFNTAADVTAADFSVNKGTVKSNVANVVIAEDKKSATIELTSKLTAGEYTVTVAQKDAEALTGSVKVEDEKVAKIDILSDVAPFATTETNNEAATATVAVKVLNQYGEDITKAYAGSVTENTAGAATSADLSAEGVLTLTLKAGSKENDTAVITLVHGATGVAATKTVTLSAKSTSSEITFGEVYNKDGKTLSQDTDLSKDKFYLPITVKDQYGKAYTSKNVNQINNEILFTNTNPAVVSYATADNSSEPIVKEVTINGEDTLALELSGTALAGTANLIAVSTSTGKSAQTSVTVAEGVKISSVTVSAPTELVTAGKTAYFPLTVLDSKGNAITTKKQLDALNVDGLSVNGHTIGEVAGKQGLYVTVAAENVTVNVPLTVVVTSTSGKVSTQTVTPKAAAVATVITGLSKDVETALRAGKSSVEVQNTDLVVEDQYGQVITDEDVLETLDFEAVSADEDTITVTEKEQEEGTFTIAPATGATKTSAKVTFKLVNAQGTAVDASAFTKTFTIVKDSEFASYSVEDIDTVYVTETQSGSYAVAEGYEEEVVVKAKTNNGQVVKLGEGDFTVVGYDETGITFDDKATTTTKTITITINATGEQFTKEVTYSKVAPKAAKVELVENNTGAAVIANTTKATYVSKDEVANVVDLDAIEGLVDIIVTDQYGEKVVADAAGEKVSAVDTITFTKVSGDVVFEQNGTEDAKVAKASADAVVNAIINVDGQTVTLQLTFSEAVAGE